LDVDRATAVASPDTITHTHARTHGLLNVLHAYHDFDTVINNADMAFT